MACRDARACVWGAVAVYVSHCSSVCARARARVFEYRAGHDRARCVRACAQAGKTALDRAIEGGHASTAAILRDAAVSGTRVCAACVRAGVCGYHSP